MPTLLGAALRLRSTPAPGRSRGAGCCARLLLPLAREEHRGRGRRIVVQGSRINIRNFLIEFAFRKPNFADFFQLAFKELIGQIAAVFKAFHVHGPALNRVILDNLVRPLAELYGALILDLESDGDNGLQAVMFCVVIFAISGSY